MKMYKIPEVSFIQIRQEDILSTSALEEGVAGDEMELVFSDIFT